MYQTRDLKKYRIKKLNSKKIFYPTYIPRTAEKTNKLYYSPMETIYPYLVRIVQDVPSVL